MEKEQLLDILVRSPKPRTVCESNPERNNGFTRYRLEKKRPEFLVPLIGLAEEFSQKAYDSNIGYRSRMNPVGFFESLEGISYISGGILFRDEETLDKLTRYFPIAVSEDRTIGYVDHGGFEIVLGLKHRETAVQFVARGLEWATSPGYAHLCLGHIPI